MPETIYDLAIIGAGPAGICAAIYGARAGLKILWLDDKFIVGGQIAETYEVDNYPGLPSITGADLGEAMGSHAAKLGQTPLRERVLSIEDQNETKIIHTKKHTYAAKTVILSCGATHRHLGIPGEEELSGCGVSYCATCDGAFFGGLTTVVIGGGNSAVEDALFLAGVCKKVYLVHRREELRADRVLQDLLQKCTNVEMVWNSVPVRIEGAEKVTGLCVKDTKNGEEKILPADGAFIAVGITPNTERFYGLVEMNEGGYMKAGEDCVTSTKGIYAAGDIRTKKLRQVVTAVADGANAVASAQQYLSELSGK